MTQINWQRGTLGHLFKGNPIGRLATPKDPYQGHRPLSARMVFPNEYRDSDVAAYHRLIRQPGKNTNGDWTVLYNTLYICGRLVERHLDYDSVWNAAEFDLHRPPSDFPETRYRVVAEDETEWEFQANDLVIF